MTQSKLSLSTILLMAFAVASASPLVSTPASAETYIFINPRTQERVRTECDIDPRRLSLAQRKEHCKPPEPYGGANPQFFDIFVEVELDH